MSSLIEWPSIYGSSYFLPAVIVVVLLLALLLLMASRRRARAERARDAAGTFKPVETAAPAGEPEGELAEADAPSSQEVFAPATRPVGIVQPVASAFAVPVAAHAMPLTPRVPVAAPIAPAAAAPVVQAEPLAETGPVASARNNQPSVRTQGPVSGVVGIDPMNAALLDILGGWGDLSPEDLKRLELYRPERLAAALAVIELPKSKSSEAKARLSQMRQHASNLEQRALDAKAAAAAAAVQSAPQAVPPQVAWSAAAPEAAPAPAVMASPAIVPLPPAVLAPAYSAMPAPPVAAEAVAMGAPTVGATPMGATTAGSTSVGATSTGTTMVGATRVTGVPLESAIAGLAAVVATGSGTDPGAAPAPTADQGTSGHSGLDDIASFWADPRSLWEPSKEVSFEGSPAPTYHEVEFKPESRPEAAQEPGPNGNGSRAGYGDITAAPPAAAPPAGVAESAPPVTTPKLAAPAPTPVGRAPLTTTDTYFWDDPPADPLSRLSVKVETAEQLLALPPQERIDMAAFLGPSELAATFRATKDPELKKAVIDTLEHIGSPASLNALGNCFEDGDGEIQLYALGAADRLLGVA